MATTMIKDELVFSKTAKAEPKTGTVQMRVKREDYESIKRISAETGKSTADVLEVLIKFAIAHVTYR